ncbi:BsuPI-related putative proteinase inhibitor [Ferrimonas balearica]|uniref:BsuPI-related putative proteinase inhibitor n=1 Tax=Ferrimonas balearica TaxID=44012 RepID=UPI001C99F82C|nr:BsuPI-related putative proteinase inhibitor [Ferrimonas balearica]MBY5920817.1 hypothetical protein [Ferrimonas balearica]MBY5996498.1 hypothetical protein [Ferrimonas balearica]
MTIKRSAILSTLCLASLVLTGCAESADSAVTPEPAAAPTIVGGQQPLPPPVVVPDNGEEHAVLATLQTSPEWSREVAGQVALVLTNDGTTAARYTIASGMLADFVLSQGKQVYWRYSQEMMFTQALTELNLAPGETRTIRVQVSASSLGKLKPGQYQISAMLNTHPMGAGPVIKPVSITLK